MPGGGIEFGETPEQTLARELSEETGLQAQNYQLCTVATSTTEYEIHGERKIFHHIGIIYHVRGISCLEDRIPEEKMCWIDIQNFQEDVLTPFALHVIKQADHFFD